MQNNDFYNGLEKGLKVKYKDVIGYIRFLGTFYLTICTHTDLDPLRDVCIVVYRSDWKLIEIINET
jgi:hypothetical protein